MTEKCSLAIAKAQDCLNLFREIAQANQDKERVIQAYQNLKVQQSTLNQKLDEFEKKTEAAKNITETQTAEKIRRALLDTVCEDLNTLKKRFKKLRRFPKKLNTHRKSFQNQKANTSRRYSSLKTSICIISKKTENSWIVRREFWLCH